VSPVGYDGDYPEEERRDWFSRSSIAITYEPRSER
jgi:hypothetical protein